MKTFFGNPSIHIAIVVLVAVSALFAGCASQPATPATSQPVSTAAPAVTSAAGPSVVALPFEVTVTVPSAWTRADVLTSDTRDYGTRAVRIATFTSPITVPGDATSFNTLNVELDQSPGADFEAYFNQATLALGKYYGTNLDSHSIVKSSTIQVSGYKSYQLDFQTTEVKGSYIFTSTDKGIYIFAFKGPNNRVPVDVLEGQITDIIKSITITPSTT